VSDAENAAVNCMRRPKRRTDAGERWRVVRAKRIEVVRVVLNARNTESASPSCPSGGCGCVVWEMIPERREGLTILK
jgi:hypothetical protein